MNKLTHSVIVYQIFYFYLLSTVQPFTCTWRPPWAGDRRWYAALSPGPSQRVESTKFLGKFWLHLIETLPSLFRIHGAFGFCTPQGPCLICPITVSNNRWTCCFCSDPSGKDSGSGGISADTVESTCSLVRIRSSWSKIITMCACDKPRLWNSTIYTR